MMHKQPSCYRIFGIDPGTRVTGYAILDFDGTTFCPLDYGVIRPPAGQALPKRYHIIYESLHTLIEQSQPDAVAIESQFVCKNPQSAIKLGMARGVASLAATQKNLPIFEYAPKQAKLSVVGTGNATKDQVQKMIRLLLNLTDTPIPDDASDALAIAICHLNTLHFQKKVHYV